MTRPLFLAVLLSTGACYAYRPVETAPPPGSRVRVMLASATDVTTIAPDGTRQPHPGVLEASGTVEAAAADTVAVRLGELRTAAGAVPRVEAHVALLPTDRIAGIEHRRFQAGATALSGLGLVTLAAAGVLLVIILTLTQGF
jgi:hypothetical protein